jgi:hypothetical protein
MSRKLINKWEFASIISPETPKANDISCMHNNEYSLIKSHRKTTTTFTDLRAYMKVKKKKKHFMTKLSGRGARTYAYPIAIRSRGINVLGS